MQTADWTTLAEAINIAAKEVLTVRKNKLLGWFEFSKDALTPLVKQRSRILHRVRQDKSILPDIAKKLCCDARQNLQDAISLAKVKWAEHLARKVHGTKLNPKEAWKAVRELQAGLTGHHLKPPTMRFRLPNGNLSQNDSENMSVLHPHMEEFNDAIQRLVNHTAPGLNGVTSEAIKGLEDDHRAVLFQILSDYFDDKIDIAEWHWGNLRALPKKGDLISPHKWQGINLLDTASKLMSRIVTTRLQKVLHDEGYPLQFGSTPRTGCPDAQFTIKNLLQLRREYDLDSWVVLWIW